MIGAILGDIVGSPFEFDRSPKIKDFGPLFSGKSRFTDDTVMTIAVAEALVKAGPEGDERVIKKLLTECMQGWGHRFPGAGYGMRFYEWLFDSSDPVPYGSYGNGSAMRVSPVGWLYNSLERTREVARWTAEVTHNHPEGVKGAESVAVVIFLARTGSGKEEIKEYIIKEFGYDLSRTLDQIRPGYFHDESCQRTVPEAMTAFFEGTDFEDVVRSAVSLGGDCDTLTDIACGMAEAFYGVPDDLAAMTLNRLPEGMKEVLAEFEKVRIPRG